MAIFAMPFALPLAGSIFSLGTWTIYHFYSTTGDHDPRYANIGNSKPATPSTVSFKGEMGMLPKCLTSASTTIRLIPTRTMPLEHLKIECSGLYGYGTLAFIVLGTTTAVIFLNLTLDTSIRSSFLSLRHPLVFSDSNKQQDLANHEASHPLASDDPDSITPSQDSKIDRVAAKLESYSIRRIFLFWKFLLASLRIFISCHRALRAVPSALRNATRVIFLSNVVETEDAFYLKKIPGHFDLKTKRMRKPRSAHSTGRDNELPESAKCVLDPIPFVPLVGRQPTVHFNRRPSNWAPLSRSSPIVPAMLVCVRRRNHRARGRNNPARDNEESNDHDSGIEVEFDVRG